MQKLKPYSKAITAFFVTFIGTLVSMVTAGQVLNAKTVLLALGTALVTTYGVYQVPNKAAV